MDITWWIMENIPLIWRKLLKTIMNSNIKIIADCKKPAN